VRISPDEADPVCGSHSRGDDDDAGNAERSPRAVGSGASGLRGGRLIERPWQTFLHTRHTSSFYFLLIPFSYASLGIDVGPHVSMFFVFGYQCTTNS
jgi:hypothetical protein